MKEILNRLFEHQTLTRKEAAEVMTHMAEGKYNDAQIAAFISVYLMRSIELEELIGFRDALLSMAIQPNLNDFELIDIVGTGGDGKNTFNISTLACFVVAGAGYCMAKHGNYAATSVSGSSNVLEFFGTKFTHDESKLKQSIERSGVAYLHAPMFNSAMKNVAPVRHQLGVRTFFNVLGPLINPAQPKFQCLGVFNLKLMRLYSYIYQQLGIQYSIIHSLDGYDEISLTAPTKMVNQRGEWTFSPEQLEFQKVPREALWGGKTIGEAADIFMQILNNTASKFQRDVVVVNAAFAIHTRFPQKTIQHCIAEATESLYSGNALKSFKAFLSVNQ